MRCAATGAAVALRAVQAIDGGFQVRLAVGVTTCLVIVAWCWAKAWAGVSPD